MTGEERARITRRQFLAGSAGVALAAVMAGHIDRVVDLVDELGGKDVRTNGVKPLTVRPSFAVSVERDTDLVLLDIAFYRFKKLSRKLVPLGPDNLITVQFPPQCIGEAAYGFTGGNWLVDPPPVLSALSGPSVLCFTVNKNSQGYPAVGLETVEDLLDWSSWTLLVPKPDTTPSDPSQMLPTSPRTYIEYPYGLFLAPTGGNPATNFTFYGRTEPLVSIEPQAGLSDCWTAAYAAPPGSDASVVSGYGVAIWAVDYRLSSPDATPEQYISYLATSKTKSQ